MTRILGIDPGSRITGYGLVDTDRGRSVYVDSGTIRADAGHLPERLKTIFDGVRAVVGRLHPDEVAVERVFVNRNPDAAIKLGQARGAAICAALLEAVPVSEYSAREIKQAIVGTGAAAKEQVQHMVMVLLGLTRAPALDASDALAVALCHGYHRQTLARAPALEAVMGRRRR